MNTMIITIDGPAGVGKSSVARLLADALGLAYLDTGAMYRSLGLRLQDDELGADDTSRRDVMAGISFGLEGAGAATRLLINGVPAGNEIRTEEAAAMASRIATLPDVRLFLQKSQQQMGAATSLVCEGRDMGSKVFPQAAHKFFLDAAPEIRAQRRFLQLQEQKLPADYDLILSQIKARDQQDRTRAVDPLRPAKDALVVDTGTLTLAEVAAQLQSLLSA